MALIKYTSGNSVFYHEELWKFWNKFPCQKLKKSIFYSLVWWQWPLSFYMLAIVQHQGISTKPHWKEQMYEVHGVKSCHFRRNHNYNFFATRTASFFNFVQVRIFSLNMLIMLDVIIYIVQWWKKYLSKCCLIKNTFSWRDKLIINTEQSNKKIFTYRKMGISKNYFLPYALIQVFLKNRRLMIVPHEISILRSINWSCQIRGAILHLL